MKRSMFLGLFAVTIVMTTMVKTSHSITCQTVMHYLMPCKDYLTKGGQIPPGCCTSVRELNGQANGQSARQEACKCMKTAAQAYKVNERYAAALPSACKVNIGYAVSYNVNCDQVR